MRVKKTDLQAALNGVRDIAARRSTIPGLNSVRLEILEGKLQVRASDGEQDESRLCAAEGDMRPICVPAAKLFAVVGNSHDDIDITIQPNNRILLESNGRVTLAYMDADSFPAVPGGKFVPVGLLCEELAEAIGYTAWARAKTTATNTSDFCLNVHCRVDGKGIMAEATDRRRLAHYFRSGIAASVDFLIADFFVDKFVETLRRPGASFFLSDRYLAVRHEAGEYYCKRPEATYPNTDIILNQARTKIGRLEIEPLKEVAAMCVLLSEDKGFVPTNLEFTANSLNVHFVEKGGEEYKASVKGKFKPSVATINMVDIVEALDTFVADVIELSFGSDAIPALFLTGSELEITTTQIRSTNPNKHETKPVAAAHPEPAKESDDQAVGITP